MFYIRDFMVGRSQKIVHISIFSSWSLIHGSSWLVFDEYECHNGVIRCQHFPCYWPFVWGINRSPVNSLHKGQWRRALMFSLIWVWINGWVNNREAGDLRCHSTHYDVTVMLLFPGSSNMSQVCRYAAISDAYEYEWYRPLCDNPYNKGPQIDID